MSIHHQVIDLIRIDARRSIRDMASHLNVPKSTVFDTFRALKGIRRFSSILSVKYHYLILSTNTLPDNCNPFINTEHLLYGNVRLYECMMLNNKQHNTFWKNTAHLSMQVIPIETQIKKEQAKIS